MGGLRCGREARLTSPTQRPSPTQAGATAYAALAKTDGAGEAARGTGRAAVAAVGMAREIDSRYEVGARTAQAAQAAGEHAQVHCTLYTAPRVVPCALPSGVWCPVVRCAMRCVVCGMACAIHGMRKVGGEGMRGARHAQGGRRGRRPSCPPALPTPTLTPQHQHQPQLPNPNSPALSPTLTLTPQPQPLTPDRDSDPDRNQVGIEKAKAFEQERRDPNP